MVRLGLILDLDFNRYADSCFNRRVKIHLDRRTKTHHQGVSHLSISSLERGFFAPPTAGRIDRDRVSRRQVGSSPLPYIGMKRAAIAETRTKEPPGIAPYRTILLVVLSCGAIDASAEKVEGLFTTFYSKP